MCFNRNINGNRDVKFLEYDYLLLQQCIKLTSVAKIFLSILYTVNGMHLIRCTLNDIGHSGIYPERKKNPETNIDGSHNGIKIYLDTKSL